MRTAIVLILFVGLSAPAFARDVYVKPHIRSDGTYVPGHHRSSPNSNDFDNFSTKGNVNPYTLESGTVDPYRLPRPRTR